MGSVGIEIAVVLSVVVAFLSGTSAVIDRLLMTDHIEKIGSIVVTSMFSTFLISVTVSLIVGVQFQIPLQIFLIIAIAGILKAFPLFFYFYAMRNYDAVTISTISNLRPVGVVILAFIFLNEQLTLFEYGGIFITIIGLFILQYESGLSIDLNKYVIAAIIVSILFSIRAILYKFSLGFVDVWSVIFFVNIFSASTAGFALYSSQVRKELIDLISFDDKYASGTVLLSESISSVLSILKFIAISLGAVSVVSPVTATSHVFTFIIIVLLMSAGIHIEEDLTNEEIVLKGIATIVVFVGISILLI